MNPRTVAVLAGLMACDLSYLGPGTSGDASTPDGTTADGGASDVITNDGTPVQDVSVDVGPGTACGSITAVQAVPGTTLGQVMQNGGSQSQQINVTAGHLLVAIVYSGQGPGSSTPTTEPNMTFTVTDQLASTWYAGPFFENPLHHESAIQIFYSPNMKGGVDLVTATTIQPGPKLQLQTGLLLQEYAGIATTDVVDISIGQSAPTKTALITPTAMTTLSGCDLVVGAFTDGYVTGQSLSAGTGWVYRSTDDWCPAGAVDDMPQGAPQGTSVDPQMILSNAPDDGWVAAQMAFRGANAADVGRLHDAVAERRRGKLLEGRHRRAFVRERDVGVGDGHPAHALCDGRHVLRRLRVRVPDHVDAPRRRRRFADLLLQRRERRHPRDHRDAEEHDGDHAERNDQLIVTSARRTTTRARAPRT